MSLNRRTVVKAITTGGALIGASVLMPRLAVAAWNNAAFGSENQIDAMQALWGGKLTARGEVNLKAPRVVDNGAIVPVTVRTDLENVETISLFVEGNLTPLVANFVIPEGTNAEVKTRIRMGKTSKITAVVLADGKLYSASQETKVIIGDCNV